MDEIVINSAFLSTLLIEVVLLVLCEKRWWQSFFTPITALAIPYTLVVLLAAVVGGHNGFVPLYYPSLAVWIIGLPVMSCVSFVMSIVFRSMPVTPKVQLSGLRHEGLYVSLMAGLLLLVALHLRGTIASSLFAFGSDDFGEDFATFGIYGHIMTVLIAMEIVAFAQIRPHKRWLYSGLILLCVFFLFVNQVKSWVIIPVLAGVWLCLSIGKLRLSIKLLMWVGLGGLLLFVLSYLVAFLIAQGVSYESHIGDYILSHVYHYLLSGVLGFSELCRLDLIDQPAPEALFAPIINLFNTIIGREPISPINPNFLYIHSDAMLGTNIRTFFGTIYLYGGSMLFVPYILLVGAVGYAVHGWARRSNALYIHSIDAWFCALFAMGWFECYTFHLRTFEVPVILLVLHILSRTEWQRKEVVCLP